MPRSEKQALVESTITEMPSSKAAVYEFCLQSSDSGTYSLPKPDGWLIYYHIADEYGDVNETVEGCSFMFEGHSVTELSHKLEEETGLEDIFVCT